MLVGARRAWFSSDDVDRATKAMIADFWSTHDATSTDVALIAKVLASPSHTTALAQLRVASQSNTLWDDAANAAKLLQQLSVLEKRDAMADQLQQTLDETKELFDLALEENEEDVVAGCVASVATASMSAKKLRAELLMSEPADPSSCFLEIHAGAGGTESCDWVDMLLRMYMRWGTDQGFATELVNAVPGDEAGYRSVCLRLDGSYAYGWTRTEAGVHRLVRISPFDSASRRHTSFAQVRVFPLAAAIPGASDIRIDVKDLRIDTYRASGPGGQHVNKTESAIRITHLPTNIVVQCQSDRSQHRNKDTAMEMLRARLLQLELIDQENERRKYTQGLGDNGWGSQIRSYVLHPYKMVKDHRTNVSKSNTSAVLDGDITPFIQEALLATAACVE
ncbi:peptide chain release factor 2 [Saprolegnia parasitica CBS 223.65]|uniref:Peptide chain release factor 2 n=1 Tax=Saprolegnia parasitica (strain CBS 223.65) TaxID=695850 RepID=A0A067CTA0_SAPPC|nr:peptide chain release factor 2 [Saprolegnia parasitica CBS 223.65]KDO32485.1 peptide chain release factor 2 [Saprolegnia parasitica CBS 223.65]|eukprot:XP_012196934.1 peptide chain release factor 2 [Saprolegnia parasitica CBS 223.65]